MGEGVVTMWGGLYGHWSHVCAHTSSTISATPGGAHIVHHLCYPWGGAHRVAWVFGASVPGPIEEVTPTFLNPCVLATLREVDDIAYKVLLKYSELSTFL